MQTGGDEARAGEAATDLPVRCLKLRPVGMFSNVLEVVEHAHLAQQGGYVFGIEWDRSPYASANRGGDPWTYFFEPPFPGAVERIQAARAEGRDVDILASGAPVVCAATAITMPCRVDGDCRTATFPRDPMPAKRIIDRYIRLNPDVADFVAATRQRLVGEAEFIGLHLRGMFGVGGGARFLRRAAGPGATEKTIPFHLYFDAVDAALDRFPGAPVLACTDAREVLRRLETRYGSRIVASDAVRTELGEMHHAKPHDPAWEPYRESNDPNWRIDGAQLGRDVILDAYLLAESRFFVHGISNVSRFVRLKRPDLPVDFVYDRLPESADFYQR